MTIFNRTGEDFINRWIFKNKVIIIYGARQVGKTTLAKTIIAKYPDRSLYLNCESLSVRELLESQNIEQILAFFGTKDLVVLDEAQKVRDIGLVLKILFDSHPEIQIIATGSSSFDLGNQVNEPLTGRNVKLTLYPLSVEELAKKYNNQILSEKLQHFLRFGMYPEIIEADEEQAKERLDYLAGDYLYKDVLSFETLKKPELLTKLLKVLALQIGNEVSQRELARMLETSPETIYRYMTLLESCFIIFKIHSFSRNMRNELKNGFKVYFYDLGTRNALIADYNRIENRNDIGALWENFCIVERIKKLRPTALQLFNLKFWRHYLPDKEIDFIEEKDGKIFTYEFKWNPKASGNARLPINFLQTYGGKLDDAGNSQIVEFKVIDSGNWWRYLV